MRNIQVKVHTDSTTEPISVDEAKLYCRVSGTDEDSLFADLIKAARESLEKYTSSTFAEKKLHCTWVTPPEDDTYELPYGPVISVDAVYRIDYEGNEEAMTLNSDYYVFGNQDALVKVARYWSSGILSTTSVRVEYTAGYGNAATELLPDALRLAILKQVATDYEIRENIAVGVSGMPMDNDARHLASPYRKKLWF